MTTRTCSWLRTSARSRVVGNSSPAAPSSPSRVTLSIRKPSVVVDDASSVLRAVHVDDVPREELIVGRVWVVDEDEDEVEAAQERRAQLDVLGHGPRPVVLAADGVRGREHGAARGERRDDAGLGDGDLLLLHGLE